MHAQFTNVAVIGASGAIGGACVQRLAELYPAAHVHAFARDAELSIDYGDEASIAAAADLAAQARPLDLVLVATGMLHSGNTLPEKSLRDLSTDKFARIFAGQHHHACADSKTLLAQAQPRETSGFCSNFSARW